MYMNAMIGAKAMSGGKARLYMTHPHQVTTPRPFDPSLPPREWVRDDERSPQWSEPVELRGTRLRAYGSCGVIYRFYDAGGCLLYIGQADGAPTNRWKQHRSDAAWWHLAAFVSFAYVTPLLSERLALEKAAIRAEKPLYNKQHTRSPGLVTILTREGPASVVEQFREYLIPEDFAVLVQAFAAEAEVRGMA